MTKTAQAEGPRGGGGGGGRLKIQPTPTELLELADRLERYFSTGEPDDVDPVAELRTLATTLSAREDGWQPIETAPTSDGTILIGWGQYRELDGFSPAFMRWYDSVSCWTVNAIQFYPTHWQPLPNAPTSGEGDEHQ